MNVVTVIIEGLWKIAWGLLCWAFSLASCIIAFCVCGAIAYFGMYALLGAPFWASALAGLIAGCWGWGQFSDEPSIQA